MHETHSPRIVVNKNGDHLITQGPAQPVLFISAGKQLAEFLQNPTTTTVNEISGVGAAALQTCLVAGSEFVTARLKPLTIKLRLPNGLIVVFVDETVAIDDDAWLIVLNGDILVTPCQITLRTEAAFRQAKIQVHPAGASAIDRPVTQEPAANLDLITAAITQRQKQRAAAGSTALPPAHSDAASKLHAITKPHLL